MTSHDKTQDEPMMDGATDAAAREKLKGKNEQDNADATLGSALDDSLRSIHEVGENRAAESVDGEKAP
ncbi:hypothetical protein [Salinibacterium sp. TMP30]|uniref:hypothetical protein n=1 Tax=Salinibacterium sp. TMP30 TaxID=3138237 RepID=UPI003139D958